MKKIIVIGCPGAGKSTFARALRDKTGLPLFYLDMLWHREDKSNVSREEFDRRLSDILKQDQWIIDGNFRRTMEQRIKACDTVFFLDFPVEVCLQGAKERVGKPREDMPWFEETLDEEFESFIRSFSEKELPKIQELLQIYNSKNIITFKNRTQLNEYIENL